MKKIFYSVLFISTFIFSSCVGDLDQFPHKETTSADVYAEAANYKAVLGKLYVSFVTAGQEKGGGNADLSSNNGQDYMRCYFNLQECGTDELASTWLEGDKVGDLTYLTWDANDTWVSDMYYRIYYTIALCNEFLRNAGDGAGEHLASGQHGHIRRLPDGERRTVVFIHVEHNLRIAVICDTQQLLPHGHLVAFLDVEVRERSVHRRAGRAAA